MEMVHRYAGSGTPPSAKDDKHTLAACLTRVLSSGPIVKEHRPRLVGLKKKIL